MAAFAAICFCLILKIIVMFDLKQLEARRDDLFGLIDDCIRNSNDVDLSLVTRVYWARLAVSYYDELQQVDCAILRCGVEKTEVKK